MKGSQNHTKHIPLNRSSSAFTMSDTILIRCSHKASHRRENTPFLSFHSFFSFTHGELPNHLLPVQQLQRMHIGSISLQSVLLSPPTPPLQNSHPPGSKQKVYFMLPTFLSPETHEGDSGLQKLWTTQTLSRVGGCYRQTTASPVGTSSST